MAFKTGDVIVHPTRGAGIVTGIKERKWRGDRAQYYKIKLLSQPGTKLMIPTKAARKIGMRRAISRIKLRKLWRVLLADPNKLPSDHKERYQLLKDKLGTGDIFQVAEVVRDMAWRQRQKNHLTTVGKRIYDEGLKFLVGEVAAVQDVDFADADSEVRQRLLGSLASATPQ
jgi:CarD family transcriptional regulator